MVMRINRIILRISNIKNSKIWITQKMNKIKNNIKAKNSEIWIIFSYLLILILARKKFLDKFLIIETIMIFFINIILIHNKYLN